jgi:hypothetical protein
VKYAKKNIKIAAFGRHLKYEHDMNIQKYYDIFFKKDEEGFCLKCKKPTKFFKLREGYKKYCKKCSKQNVAMKAKKERQKRIANYIKLHGESKCIICGGKTKWICNKLGFRKFCSNECKRKRLIPEEEVNRKKEKFKEWLITADGKKYLKNLSESRKGDKNPVHRRTKESIKCCKEKQSKTMKNKIANGEFTPCVTNSWANSRCKISINGFTKLYRSSWDAAFQILNPEYLYEKIRIKYISPKDDKWHNYIVDFIDEENKILYEIKPEIISESKQNQAKFNAAENWAKDNNFKFIVIQNNYFKENANKIDFSKYDSKIYKGMKQFL